MSEKKAKFTAIDAIIILVILAVIVVGAINSSVVYKRK